MIDAALDDRAVPGDVEIDVPDVWLLEAAAGAADGRCFGDPRHTVNPQGQVERWSLR
jgi:hypothetical protein